MTESQKNAVLHDIIQLRHPILKRNVPEEKEIHVIKSPKHPGVEFIRHQVKPSDDLTVLAIRYGTTESEIRRYNRRVVFDSLENVLFDFILIPIDGNEVRRGNTFPDQRPEEQIKVDKQVDEKYMKMRCFLLHGGPGTKFPQASKLEAEFYLEEGGYVLGKALEQWKDDITWEMTHPFVPSETKVILEPSSPSLSRRSSPTPRFRQRSVWFSCFRRPSRPQLSITTDLTITPKTQSRRWSFHPFKREKRENFEYHMLELAPISYV